MFNKEHLKDQLIIMGNVLICLGWEDWYHFHNRNYEARVINQLN